MNLSLLDREQLEAIVLDPPCVEREPLRCSEALVAELLPPARNERCTRLRHALGAAHELLARIAAQAMVGRQFLASPTVVKDLFKVMFAGVERETFVVVYLDAHNRVITTEELFAGTLTQTSVHPREIVRRALLHNAAGVVLAHPHPFGVAKASRADQLITQRLKDTLALVDVRLIDHFIVAGNECISFAEGGLL